MTAQLDHKSVKSVESPVSFVSTKLSLQEEMLVVWPVTLTAVPVAVLMESVQLVLVALALIMELVLNAYPVLSQKVQASAQTAAQLALPAAQLMVHVRPATLVSPLKT